MKVWSFTPQASGDAVCNLQGKEGLRGLLGHPLVRRKESRRVDFACLAVLELN